MSVVVNKLDVAGLARELVRAFAATGGTRAAMPAGRADAVRELLTRAVVNRGVLDEHRRALDAAFRAERVAPPGDLFPLPLYDSAEVAAHGFARLDPDALAAVALDPAGFETIDELLNWEIPRGKCEVEAVGGWFDEATGRWGVTPPPLPEWLTDAMSTGALQEAPRKPGGWSWINVVLGVALAGAVAAGVYGTLRERDRRAVEESGERVHRDLDLYGEAITLGRPEEAAAGLRDAIDAAERATGPLPESARIRLDRKRAGYELADLLLGTNDLPAVERSLATLAEVKNVGELHAVRYARAITSRRQGNLGPAAVEFEALLNLLGDKPVPVDPPPEPAASEPQSAQVAFVIGDPARSLENVRLLHATTLLEAGETRNARVQLNRQVQERDTRPFGPRYLLAVCDRVIALDPQLPALLDGRVKPTSAAGLRDAAFLCLYRGHYTTAAALFESALAHPDYAKIPKPVGAPYDHARYFAAAAAVRSGRFGDKDTPTAAASEAWHKKAIGWMRDEAKPWPEVFGKSAAGVMQTYYWYSAVRHDFWLAVTRDKPMADLLSPVDRSEWATFWDDLELRYGGLRERPVDDDSEVPIN